MGSKTEGSAVARDDRPRIANLGEWYEDLLQVDSVINARTVAQQATSLLCAKLQEREERIKKRVQYLAVKRGVSFEEMWLQILKGEYRKLTAEEMAELERLESFE
ncbi:hypothetical protein [Leptolyngbya sp. FACHB-16]|uniref:hypothetical protein n=1 Tax=unclassified Leptolyngbya TaxID=2650499 RepID=UPI001689393E|nr:hypothetical protein [Leptolyngbya sp. FACHB-16]MBD2156251.1 hypothetical protein [Leptolyngbya sp. FACHB-16]